MCSLKKIVIVANFFLCCLSLAGVALLVYRSHEEGLLSSEAVKGQKLNLPLAQGCLLVVVVLAAGLGIVGIVKRASGLLIVNAVLLQLLLMAETTLCGYFAGDQNGANTIVKKLGEVLTVGQRKEAFTVDIDLESEVSTSLIVIVALQIIVQEVIIICTWFIAFQLRYYDGEITDFRSKSYTKVTSQKSHQGLF